MAVYHAQSQGLEKEDLAKLKIDRSDKPAPELLPVKKRIPRWLAYAAVFGAILIGVLFYGGLLTPHVEVKTATVSRLYPAEAYTLLNATGYVVPQTKADVASKATGRLEKLTVREGDRVKKGQIIAQLENDDVVASLKQAAANVALAKANHKQAEAELKEATLALERANNLIKKDFISRERLDAEIARHAKAKAAVESANASINAAQAAYEAAQVAVKYTLIRAPFDGTILTKQADLGDVVAPFASTTESKGAVVSMADMDTLEVEVDVSESNLLKVKLDQPCEVQLDALPETRLRCRVSRIVPTVDRTKATVLVKVRFVDKDERILPDMSAKVAFLARELTPEQAEPVTVVQSAAVTSRDGQSAVFLVQGHTVKKIAIETRGKIEDSVIVSQGLKPGDRVVLKPPDELKDGAAIRIAS